MMMTRRALVCFYFAGASRAGKIATTHKLKGYATKVRVEVFECETDRSASVFMHDIDSGLHCRCQSER